MDASIRVIGVASTFLWILLVAFFASAAYSVKDLHLDIKKPQLSLTQEGFVVISIPVKIENGGFYNLCDFNLTTMVADLNGSKITEGSTLIPVVRRGDKIDAFHNLTFSLSSFLLDKGVYYLFNDSHFNVTALISMKLAEVIPVQALSNFSVPWGAPLYNFHVGQPNLEPHNITHLKVYVPLSFENHSPVEVNGEIRLYMHSDGETVGYGETTVAAPQGALCTCLVLLYVEASRICEEGFLEVYLSTQLFSYGPLVIPYG